MVNLIQTLGFALLACGAYAVLHARLADWRRPVEPTEQKAPKGPDDEREARLRAAVARLRHAREVRWFRLAAALMIVGLLLLVLAWTVPRSLGTVGAGGGAAAGPGSLAGTGAAAPPAPPALGGIPDAVFWLSALLIVTGGLMAVAARDNVTRIAGAATIAAGVATHGTLIGKVEKLFAFDLGGVKVDLKAELQAEIHKELASIARFRPQYLGGVEGFALGRSSLDPDGFDDDDAAHATAQQEVARICAAWQEQGAWRRDETLILIVGGTDRLALGGAARSRYEANAGLAQARAAALKQELERRCLSPLATAPGRVLLLASGPATTPSRALPEEQRLGYPRDRRADVWVLSTVTPQPPAPPAR